MTTRITGLASGMDIDSIVKDLMKPKKATLDSMVQKRTVAEWQQEAYRDMSTKIVDFRNNKLSSYSLSGAINAKTSEVSGNTSAITVTSTASGSSGTLNIKVNSTASTASSLFTFDPDSTGSTVDSTTGQTLADLGFAVDGSNNGSITINGKAIAYKGSDSLSALVSAINAKKDAKVTALVNETTGQLSISNNQTGAGMGPGGTVSISGIPGTFAAATPTAGANADITVNGVTYTQSNNAFSVNGVNFTVNSASGSAGPTMLTVKTDTDKIVNTIKSFVSDYNSLIDSVNTKLGEDKYRTYLPLTDEQKETMTDSQITLWDQKAHSGLLRNDSILTSMVSDLRIASTSVVGGININSIGIGTGTWEQKGKLVIQDESKLRQAIEADPDKVVALFTASGTDKKPTSTTSGIFTKMSTTLMQSLKDVSARAGTSTTSTDTNSSFLENSLLSEQIRHMKDDETDFTSKMNDAEDHYYQMFAAMEDAINKYNSQSSALSSFA